VRIVILVEGDTERVFLPTLRAFLSSRLQGKMPSLKTVIYDGRAERYDRCRFATIRAPS
jgi:hypothetical protein